MNTVTVCAYNRPDYLYEVLRALSASAAFAPGFPLKVFVGIDPGGSRQKEVEAVARHWLCDSTETLIVWPDHLGVSEHPRRMLQFIFSEVTSGFNLHLEDDTVISPDAIRLCEWYVNHRPGTLKAKDSCWLSLHSPVKDKDNHDLGLIVPRYDFGVWGWACTSLAWFAWICSQWNHRRTHPTGWDWSLSDTMKQKHLTAVAPALSRVHNIGREGGTFQTPEGYDEEMKESKWATEADMQRVEDFHYEYSDR